MPHARNLPVITPPDPEDLWLFLAQPIGRKYYWDKVSSAVQYHMNANPSPDIT